MVRTPAVEKVLLTPRDARDVEIRDVRKRVVNELGQAHTPSSNKRRHCLYPLAAANSGSNRNCKGKRGNQSGQRKNISNLTRHAHCPTIIAHGEAVRLLEVPIVAGDAVEAVHHGCNELWSDDAQND